MNAPTKPMYILMLEIERMTPYFWIRVDLVNYYYCEACSSNSDCPYVCNNVLMYRSNNYASIPQAEECEPVLNINLDILVLNSINNTIFKDLKSCLEKGQYPYIDVKKPNYNHIKKSIEAIGYKLLYRLDNIKNVDIAVFFYVGDTKSPSYINYNKVYRTLKQSYKYTYQE